MRIERRLPLAINRVSKRTFYRPTVSSGMVSHIELAAKMEQVVRFFVVHASASLCSGTASFGGILLLEQ